VTSGDWGKRTSLVRNVRKRRKQQEKKNAVANIEGEEEKEKKSLN